jgi:SPP1 gp7 family putative phage head morphogenesis protein
VAKFAPTRATEAEFRRNLRAVARVVGGIIKPHLDGEGGIINQAAMVSALEHYSQQLEPWASRIVYRMLSNIGTSNLRAWSAQSADLGKALQSVYANEAIGQTWRMLHTRQVELIKSLPTEAAKRAVTIAANAQLGGIRARDIADDIRDLDNSGAVTESRALLIARTEIAKANAAMTQARATFVGSTNYIWRTMHDPEVRASHWAMEGVVCEWANPPEVENEGNHHPGEWPNCRCFAEPIITGYALNANREAAYQAAAGDPLEGTDHALRIAARTGDVDRMLATLERIRDFLELAA